MYLSGERPNVVDVGRALKDLFEAGQPWENVKPYLECIFEVEDADAEASPGAAFEMR